MAVFCFGPLPGERARVAIAEVKAKYAVARLLEILSESPARTQPFCPVFGSCGGCQLQHLAYPAQLAWKRDVVRNAMTRIGGLTVEVAETIGMREPRAYRNKMSLVVDHRTKPPALGFYRQRSHDVVAIDACPIVSPVLDAALERLVALRDAPAVGAAFEQSRHLVARSSAAAGELVLTLTTPQRANTLAAPVLMREIPRLAGVSNSYDLGSENAILGHRRQELAGRSEIEETIGGVSYRISTASFFQVNVEIVARIFAFLEPWLAPAGRMVDLYCGIGTFSLYFAKHGWSVYGIEENRHAVNEATANARRNGLIGRVRFETGRVERLVAAPALRTALRDAGTVFLDPPRKGCDELALAAIARAGAGALWYLSCDSATLARDSKYLVANGYRITIVQPFDMFPQTGHVETLVRFER